MKKGYFLIRTLCLLVFLIHTPLFAQKNSKDVLEQQIKDIFEQYPNSPDSALALFRQLLNTAAIKNDMGKTGKLYIGIGKEYFYKKKDVGQAMDYFNKAVDLAKKAGICDVEIQAIIGQNLVYFRLNQLDMFLKSLENVAILIEKCPKSHVGAHIHTQLGTNYARRKDTALAEKHYLIADSIANARTDIENNSKSYIYGTIMNFYYAKHNHEKTLFYAQKAKAISLKSINATNKSDLIAYTFVADLFKNIGEIDSALYYAHLLAQFPPQNFPEYSKRYIYSANNMLGELYEKKGDNEKAIFYQKKYINYLDSMVNISSTNNGFDKINLLEKQLALEKQQRQLDKNQWILLLIGSLMTVILLVLGIIYYDARKVKKLNALLLEQKQELTALNEIRTKMFSVLSHDLISPISGLKNMVEMYHKGFFTQEDLKTYTVDLKHNLDAILKTIQNILGWSYTQLNGKKPFIEPLNIHKIITEQFDLQKATAQQKNIELNNNVPNDFTVNADFNQMSLIVRNLIDNALKYTPNGGKIDVNAVFTEGGKILEFKDTGIGMSAEQIQSLFNFEPKSTHISKKKGVGLGLQMVNDLLKANNCTISVQSKANNGSIFRLLFPT